MKSARISYGKSRCLTSVLTVSNEYMSYKLSSALVFLPKHNSADRSIKERKYP